MSRFFTCPNCGADVPMKARACPECGFDEETGWSDAAKYIHLLPHTDSSETDASPSKIRWKSLTAIIAVFLTVTFLAIQGLTWSIYVIPLAALAGVAVYYASRRFSMGHWGMERQLYRQLLSRTRNNRELAKRLIEYERQRNPDSSQLQLLQNAIYRWDRDRK